VSALPSPAHIPPDPPGPRLSEPRPSEAPGPAPHLRPRRHWGSHLFLAVAAVLWITPVLWAFFLSLRPLAETNKYGYLSRPRSLTLDNFRDAWTQADLPHYFLNSIIITVPAVLVTLFAAACVAFGLARLGRRLNLFLLILFTAGNLLPQQVIITPLYRIYLSVHLPTWLSDSGLLYDSTLGLVVINVSFQLGFCVFVLSNYMRTIPVEITEAALIDGASLWTRFWRLTLPLCRPALAALATLLTIWIYNDFFWAIALMSTGSKRPITSALANLQGQFFVNDNLLAAGALLTAIPTLVVFVLLQKQFISGLALGATKG